MLPAILRVSYSFNAENEAENDEKSVRNDTMEESLVGVDKISDLAEGDNLEQIDSKLTEEALKDFGLPPESNIPAEVGQLSSTSSNGLVLPLLQSMVDGSSCPRSKSKLAVWSCLPENTQSCLCQVLQMGTSTGPLYKYLTTSGCAK
jgi:hypothetical protein